MTEIVLSRRGFLASACCLAAAPVFTPVTFAAMPGDNRFVTIVLRGAMDGLDLVQPYGDAGFASFETVNLLTVNPIGISSKPTASESLNLAPAKGFGRL